MKLPLPRFTPDMLDFNLSDPMRELVGCSSTHRSHLSSLAKRCGSPGSWGRQPSPFRRSPRDCRNERPRLGEALPFRTARRYAESASRRCPTPRRSRTSHGCTRSFPVDSGAILEAKRPPRDRPIAWKKNIMAVCGGEGLKGLKRELAAMVAHDDHGQLSKYELAAGLEDKGISLNNRELGEVFRHFDADHSGARYLRRVHHRRTGYNE